jgi:predicted ribosome quality control (RQC) complex YloA/Tae2 family protein
MIYTDPNHSTPVDVVPVQLKFYDDLSVREISGFNSAIAQFFEPKDLDLRSAPVPSVESSAKSLAVPHTDKFSAERARLQRQLEQQQVAIERFTNEIELNHSFGETIYTNYKRCEEILNEIIKSKETMTDEEILEQVTRNEYIDALDLHERYVIVKAEPSVETKNNEELKLRLDLRKNVIQNANHYYELSKHSKEKLVGAQTALKNTEGLLKKLAKQADLQDKKVPRQRITKHFWYEKYHWFNTSSGNLVVAGRDAKSNDAVVKKHLKDADRYCHADISGAASVVIKSNPDDDEISPESLAEACQFAVIFSKAWNSKVGSGTAYWVKPDQVSKTPQSGEFLGRGAFVIRGKRNYITGVKLELAVGEIKVKGQFKLMSGPVSAISVHSDKYVILQPGNEKKNATANILSKLFNITVDDILSLLPSGEFTITDKVGFKD